MVEQQVSQGPNAKGPLKVELLNLLDDFDKLEALFKHSSLMTLGLDANVLNEYRYFARALVDMVREWPDGEDYATAKGRAETAYSSALCDTIDNILMHVRGVLRRIGDQYPAFQLKQHLEIAKIPDALSAMDSIEKLVARSREDRASRKDIYLKIANSDDFTTVIALASELPKMNAAAPSSVSNDSWLRKILDGLRNDEFHLAFQPKRCVKTGELKGAEALLRWKRGPISISPAVFIPKAEENGTIHLLGDFVIAEACKALGRWQTLEGLKNIALSINVSPTQLLDPDFSTKLKGKIEEHKIPTKMLELEITEDVLIHDKREARRHLNELKECSLAVDDFGKGSTEFQYLAEFAVNVIKIDRALVIDALQTAQPEKEYDDPDLETGENSYRKLIRGIVGLAKGVKAKIVAEGVDSELGIKMLEDLNIDVYQGYYNDGKTSGYPVQRHVFEEAFGPTLPCA